MKSQEFNVLQPTPIIHDGDHGSDDFLATLVALGRRDVIDLLGIITCHGNVSVAQATRNACCAADFARPHTIPVLSGASKPWKTLARCGDDAFGTNGLGGVELPEPSSKCLKQDACAWMIERLSRSEVPVTLCVTGPLSNIAHLIEGATHLREKVKAIIVMGGCLGPLGPQQRFGNITPFAEFNFYMDPEAADNVLQSGWPIILLPMDVTHQLVFTPARKEKALNRWPGVVGADLIRMLTSAEHLDQPKFGLVGAVIHDVNVMLYLLAPQLYRERQISVRVNTDQDGPEYGRLSEIPPSESQILLIDTLLDSDAAFDLMLDAVCGFCQSR